MATIALRTGMIGLGFAVIPFALWLGVMLPAL